MSKLLLLVLAVFILYLLIKGVVRKSAASAKKQEGRGRSEGERMVSCAQCGVNLPKSEALSEGGVFFCSPSHRASGAR